MNYLWGKGVGKPIRLAKTKMCSVQGGCEKTDSVTGGVVNYPEEN